MRTLLRSATWIGYQTSARRRVSALGLCLLLLTPAAQSALLEGPGDALNLVALPPEAVIPEIVNLFDWLPHFAECEADCTPQSVPEHRIGRDAGGRSTATIQTTMPCMLIGFACLLWQRRRLQQHRNQR